MLRRLALAVVVVVVLTAAGAWWVRGLLVAPYGGFAGEEVFVDLPQGLSVAEIGERLASAGVVAHALVFRLAARAAGADRRLQAGEYRFAAPATPAEVVGRLAKGDVFTRTVTFPEGHTIAEMAAIFEASGLGPRGDLLREGDRVLLVAEFDATARDLEGYLFPDTYRLPRRVGAAGTVDAMVAGFRRAFDATLRAGAEARGLSVRQAVTLASLIEKETARAEERELVSAVYHNRLRIGMPLQCDPTVIYALMRAGRWNGNLTRADLQLDSRYNTYRYPGLPPGPIAAPGRASLQAAVLPADVKHLYFVSRNDGSHAFASTLAEHNRNVQQWQVRYFQGRKSTGR